MELQLCIPGVLLLFLLSSTALRCMQVCKVYIGSFNADKPIRTDMNPSGEELFNKEQADLLQDLFEIPQRSCDRKVCSLWYTVLCALVFAAASHGQTSCQVSICIFAFNRENQLLNLDAHKLPDLDLQQALHASSAQLASASDWLPVMKSCQSQLLRCPHAAALMAHIAAIMAGPYLSCILPGE